MRLSFAESGYTKTYTLTDVVPLKPYLNINGNYYLPLTTNDCAGVRVTIQKGNTTYRPMEYTSSSGQTNYYTTSTSPGNMSNTTALTSTYITNTVTNTSYNSNTIQSNFEASFYRILHTSMVKGGRTVSGMFGASASTYGGAGSAYLVSEGRGTINAANARANYISFQLTQNVNMGDVYFTIVNNQTNTQYSSQITAQEWSISSYLTAQPYVGQHFNGEVIYATSSTNDGIIWAPTVSNMYYSTFLYNNDIYGRLSTAVSDISSSYDDGRYKSIYTHNITRFIYQELFSTYTWPSYLTGTYTYGYSGISSISGTWMTWT